MERVIAQVAAHAPRRPYPYPPRYRRIHMRLVLDTGVMVAAFRSETGASHQLVLAALDRRCVLLVSTALWLEYEAVLVRQEHLDAARSTATRMRVGLDSIDEVAEPVVIAFRWRLSARDANDDLVVEVAVNGQADALVTFNRKDFAAAERLFQFQLLSPGEALRQLR